MNVMMPAVVSFLCCGECESRDKDFYPEIDWESSDAPAASVF